MYLMPKIFTALTALFASTQLDVDTLANETHGKPPSLHLIYEQPEVADLLIGSVYSGAKGSSASDSDASCLDEIKNPLGWHNPCLAFLLQACNERSCTLHDIVRLLEITPSVSEMGKYGDLEDTLRKIDEKLPELLMWIFSLYDGTLIAAPVDMQLKTAGTQHQFILQTAGENQDRLFKKKSKGLPTSALFHGTKYQNLPTILRYGILPSDSLNGYGVFFGRKPARALLFSRDCKRFWPNSMFKKNSQLLLGAEGVVTMDMDAGSIVKDYKQSILRYVLVFEGQDSISKCDMDLGDEMKPKFTEYASWSRDTYRLK